MEQLKAQIEAANIDPDTKPVLLGMVEALDAISKQIAQIIDGEETGGALTIDLDVVKAQARAMSRLAAGELAGAEAGPEALVAFWDSVQA